MTSDGYVVPIVATIDIDGGELDLSIEGYVDTWTAYAAVAGPHPKLGGWFAIEMPAFTARYKGKVIMGGWRGRACDKVH